MRPLVIGQAPSAGSNPAEPFSGASGRRLAKLAGMPHAEFLRAVDRANLIEAYPGRGEAGDAFPLVQARAAAQAMGERVAAREVVVLLGLGVASAFRLRRVQFLAWTRLSRDTGLVAVCPHPSGRSRWWNDPANVEAARSFWRALLDHTP